jgi:hypothetical protein
MGFLEASMFSDTTSKIYKQNNPPWRSTELRDPLLTKIPEIHSQENATFWESQL